MTENEIVTLCENLKKSLLEANKRNDPICFKSKHYHEEITSSPDYGLMPIDALYVGTKITIKIGKPAISETGKMSTEHKEWTR